MTLSQNYICIMEYLLHWVWIETKMCSITNLFIPHAAWTGWQTVSHLIFHTRYRGRGGLAPHTDWPVSGMWFISDGGDCWEHDRTFIRVSPLWGDSRHRPGPGAMVGTQEVHLTPSRYLVCDVSGGERAIVRQRNRPEPRLSQWALFWLSGSCPNKYSNMAIVGVRFSNGNVIWAKCD